VLAKWSSRPTHPLLIKKIKWLLLKGLFVYEVRWHIKTSVFYVPFKIKILKQNTFSCLFSCNKIQVSTLFLFLSSFARNYQYETNQNVGKFFLFSEQNSNKKKTRFNLQQAKLLDKSMQKFEQYPLP
jgi:hypothetical protein